MSNEKKKCTDCLHCKVSVKSTENYRLCYCTEIGKKAVVSENYWRDKAVCKNFKDMTHE